MICRKARKRSMDKEHSKNFDKYKGWYESGLWNRGMLYNIVGKGKITAEEYEEITGEAFE